MYKFLSLLHKTLGIVFKCHILSMCHWTHTCSMNMDTCIVHECSHITQKNVETDQIFDQNLRRFQDQSGLYSQFLWMYEKPWVLCLHTVPVCRFGLPLRSCSLSIGDSLQADLVQAQEDNRCVPRLQTSAEGAVPGSPGRKLLWETLFLECRIALQLFLFCKGMCYAGQHTRHSGLYSVCLWKKLLSSVFQSFKSLLLSSYII